MDEVPGIAVGCQREREQSQYSETSNLSKYVNLSLLLPWMMGSGPAKTSRPPREPERGWVGRTAALSLQVLYDIKETSLDISGFPQFHHCQRPRVVVCWRSGGEAGHGFQLLAAGQRKVVIVVAGGVTAAFRQYIHVHAHIPTNIHRHTQTHTQRERERDTHTLHVYNPEF